MAPFYSTLSIWIGGIVLVAMLKTGVSTKCTEGLKKVKPHQEYLAVISSSWSSVCCKALWSVWEICYIWASSVSIRSCLCWQDGSRASYMWILFIHWRCHSEISEKAVSVVLLVMQVAGSGGTFPIEVAPAFFKAVYPLLPFVHSMAAFRERLAECTVWHTGRNLESWDLPAFVIDSRTASAQTGNPDERGICRKAGRDKDYVMITCIYCSFFLTWIEKLIFLW